MISGISITGNGFGIGIVVLSDRLPVDLPVRDPPPTGAVVATTGTATVTGGFDIDPECFSNSKSTLATTSATTGSRSGSSADTLPAVGVATATGGSKFDVEVEE